MTPTADEALEARAPALPWWSLLPWQERGLRELMQRRSGLAHALLVHGRAGIGKHVLALHIAQALLCESPTQDGLACGACPACRYALAGQHPDLMRLERLQLDEETGETLVTDTIGIDRIRALIDFVQLTSHRHRAKVAIIAPAERMNLAAANALLKTLEEPPAGTYLLLVSAQVGRLPATIVSRCRKVAAPEPSMEEANAWLRTCGVAASELLLAQAGGAPLTALALADTDVQQERRAWLDALARPEKLAPVQLAARIELGGRDERKARLAHALEWLLAWTADLARASASTAATRNPDFADAIAILAPRMARVPLFRYHRSLLEQRALLVHALQPRLVAETLLIDYRNLFTPGTRP